MKQQVSADADGSARRATSRPLDFALYAELDAEWWCIQRTSVDCWQHSATCRGEIFL